MGMNADLPNVVMFVTSLIGVLLTLVTGEIRTFSRPSIIPMMRTNRNVE
jgi:hypothetical protein